MYKILVDTHLRVSALSLPHHLLYHTTNGTVAFFCFTRLFYSHTLIFMYLCHYYAANLM